MKFLSALLFFLLAAITLCAAEGTWRAEGAKLTLTPEGLPLIEAEFPGGVLLFRESDRKTFRPVRAAFEAGSLELEGKVESGSPGTIRGVLFVKDKEGHWFQSTEEFRFPSGEWVKASVRLDRPGREWHAVGHDSVFDADTATRIYTAGISLYGDREQKFSFECRSLALAGKREQRPLRIIGWELPAEGVCFKRVESRFQLEREFFNSFDPEEVTVDFELKSPGGETKSYPGFFSRDYRRNRHFTRETVTPTGPSYWAVRFTPSLPGEYQIRLKIKDQLTGEETLSSWRTFRSLPGKERGPVRVSAKNNGFFEFANGEFYFPVGLNIHTNTDRRSEIGFRFGHLPDRGTYDYDDYLDACGKAGINAVEVWMAGWTMAIEHDAGRSGYYGVGRYNLDAAWRLDQVIERAGRNGILVNLVIDNHGRLSDTSDPEWRENPINSRGEYAVANGGFLENPGDFFRSEAAWKNNSKRARYIGARWGGTPDLLAIELWSEVDLTAEMRQRYADGSIIEWHKKAAAEMKGFSQLDLPVSTHICSDFRNLLGLIKLFQTPEISHLAGDAYRDIRQHFAEHLRDYSNHMKGHGKPQLITEYGGNPSGSAPEQLLGDIHSGLWGSLFSRLAGTPFLWWHDFVHINGYYDHYRAFADYLKGIDLRVEKLDYLAPAVTVPAPPKDQRYQAMAVVKPGAAYGWIYNHEATFRYPADANAVPEVKETVIQLETALLPPGEYLLRFFSTLPCREISSGVFRVEKGKGIFITTPPFRTDIAFKLEPFLPE